MRTKRNPKNVAENTRAMFVDFREPEMTCRREKEAQFDYRRIVAQAREGFKLAENGPAHRQDFPHVYRSS
jgi:hypothetical protein